MANKSNQGLSSLIDTDETKSSSNLTNNTSDNSIEIAMDNFGMVTITDESKASDYHRNQTYNERRNEDDQKKKEAVDGTRTDKRRTAAATKRVRTMLTNDWLADMVNNNMGANSAKSGAAGAKLEAVIQLEDVSVRYRPFSIGQWLGVGDDDVATGTGVSSLGTQTGSIGNCNSRFCFKSLNIGFPCSRIFAIIGSPKTGKTCLLQVLAKIRSPNKGKIKYLGPDRNRHLSIGYMGQSDSYFDQLSPTENMHLFGRVFAVKPVVVHNKLHRLLQLIGWERQHQPMHRLSPIEQTLTSLALATIHSPAILILDEPNFGADLFLKEHIWRQLKKLTRQEFVSIVFSTSFVEDVRFADEAAFVRGRTLVSCTLSNTKTSLTSKRGQSKSDSNRCGSSTSSTDTGGATDEDDIQNLLSVDVEKIRHFVAQSYQNIGETNIGETAPKRSPKTSSFQKHNKKSSSNISAKMMKDDKPYEEAGANKVTRSESGNPGQDQVQLEMSNWYSDRHYQKTSLKRIHQEPSCLTKFWLVFWLLVKLSVKRPFYLVAQLVMPGLMLGLFNQFVGQNPANIAVAVFNPDQPSIVSRHVLNSVDTETIALKPYETLQAALDAIRQHKVWAAIEFPANYTNSMINRAIQNCDANADDFEEEPESETISDNLLMDGGIDGATGGSAVHRVRRKRLTNSDEISSKEEKVDDAVITTTVTAGGMGEMEDDVDGAAAERNNNEEEEGEGKLIHDNDLWNDLEVNRKKTRPINLITVRLYVDNTNLLIGAFVKGKLFQALQRAEQDPDVEQFALKLPPPLEIVSPAIYGQEETPMSAFLIPGIAVVLVFLCSAILPLEMLDKLHRHSAYRTLQLAGIGRLTLIACWASIQVSILLVQVAFVILVLYTVTELTVLGPVGLLYLVLFIQGLVALTQTALIRLVLTANANENGLLYTVLIEFGQFFYTITIGGIIWPMECLPGWVQSVVQYLPQVIGAETLRFVINRGWTFGDYFNSENSILFRGLNIPMIWLCTLGFILVLNLKINNNNN